MPESRARADALLAPLALMLVALIWGTTPVVGQLALSRVSVPLLLALRFSAALLCFLWVRPSREAWRAGARPGLLLFAVYAAHTVGLTGTTAAKTAFIMGSSALLVPLLGWAARQRVEDGALTAAALGVLGLGVMLLAGEARLGAGDAWQLLASALFAFYVRTLAKVSGRFGAPQLALAQLCVMAPLAWAWAAPHLGELRGLSSGTLWAGAYLGVCAGGVVMLLQSFALGRLPAEQAALWLLLEPVFTVLIVALILGVMPTPNVLAGGAVVLLALSLGASTGAGARRRTFPRRSGGVGAALGGAAPDSLAHAVARSEPPG